MRVAWLGPPLTIMLLAGPITLGLAGTVLPAFGYLPALGGMDVTLAHFETLAGQPGVWASARMSLFTGLASAAIGILVTMSFVAAWAGTRTFARVQHLISPLLSVPHAAAAFGLAFLIAPSGFAARLVSPQLTGWERPPDLLIVNDPMGLSLIAGLVVKEVPFLLLITLAAIPQVRLAETRMLAASLGYGRMAGFLHLAWPQIYRQIRLAVFAVIAFASSVVDVAVILGPNSPPPLAVRLVGWMNDPDLSMRHLASAGAMLQLGVTALALVLWLVLERIAGRIARLAAASGIRFRRDAGLRQVALTAMSASAVLVFAGMAVLGLWSVAGLWQFPDAFPSSLTARSWASVASRIAGPLGTTLAVAALSTLAAIVLAVMCLLREDQTGQRPRRAALILIYLPLLVPQAAFLFGLQLVFLLTDTVASLGALVLAHLVFVLPYVFLSLSDPWRGFDTRYEAIARGLGKRPAAVLFGVRLPMLLRPVLTAAAVGFAVSVGLYLPTVLIGAGRLPTVTTEAVALATGGNRRIIGVYAFVQMALPAIGFALAIMIPALLFRRRRLLGI
jgi:putative thiamine transport system permease protein